MRRVGRPQHADQRIQLAEIPAARVVIRCRGGRVELSQSRGASVRVRITEPEARGPLQLRRRFLPRSSVRIRSGVLMIRSRDVRMQVELPLTLAVLVTMHRGEITSWGAGGELELISPGGRVTCRELLASQVKVQASRASLHFAQSPERVEVDAERVTLALPAGEYAVSAPAEAEITVDSVPAASRQIIVRAAVARILASQRPLSLTDEGGCGS